MPICRFQKEEMYLASPIEINLLIHVNVRQKPLKYCKVISFQLIKINEKKKKKESCNFTIPAGGRKIYSLPVNSPAKEGLSQFSQ